MTHTGNRAEMEDIVNLSVFDLSFIFNHFCTSGQEDGIYCSLMKPTFEKGAL